MLPLSPLRLVYRSFKASKGSTTASNEPLYFLYPCLHAPQPPRRAQSTIAINDQHKIVGLDEGKDKSQFAEREPGQFKAQASQLPQHHEDSGLLSAPSGQTSRAIITKGNNKSDSSSSSINESVSQDTATIKVARSVSKEVTDHSTSKDDIERKKLSSKASHGTRVSEKDKKRTSHSHSLETTSNTQFSLDSVQIRRLERKVKQRDSANDHRGLRNSELKRKGTWSYDWRIPLLELSKHLPISNESLVKDNITITRNVYRQFSVTEIPRPTEWTQQTFAQYIDDLAHSIVTRVMNRFIYGEGQDHTFAVEKVLNELLHDQSKQALLSSTAINTALRFFYSHDMVTSVKNLFNLLLQAETPISASSFNIMLHSCAVKHDLHNYTQLLQHSIKLGFKPNEETWYSLIRAVESIHIKDLIFKTMKENNLLVKPEIVQESILEILPGLLENMRNGKPEVSPIIESLDAQFGPVWFSTRTANMILRELCMRSQGNEVIDFLKVMVDRKCIPDLTSLEHVLSRCRRVKDIKAALGTLQLFLGEWKLSPSQNAFNLLFFTAWETRAFNACRVIWWMICVSANVSYRIQKYIQNSLRSVNHQETYLRGKIWQRDAGRMIVGIEDISPSSSSGSTKYKRRPQSQQDLIRIVADLFTLTSDKTIDSKQRIMGTKLAGALIADDLAAWQKYRMSRDLFLKLFGDAILLDEEWAQNGKWYAPLEEKLQGAVKYPFRLLATADNAQTSAMQVWQELYTES
jgi:hypothetical protein